MDICHSSATNPGSQRTLNPLLQQAHVTLSKLEPRVRHAIKMARTFCLNIQSHFPSVQARNLMLAAYHHALAGTLSYCHHALESIGLTTVQWLYRPSQYSNLTLDNDAQTHHNRKALGPAPAPGANSDPEPGPSTIPTHVLATARTWLLTNLKRTNWHPMKNLQAHHVSRGKVSIWPTQTEAQECIRILTHYRSILSPRRATTGTALLLYRPPPSCLPQPPPPHLALLRKKVVHVWTDGSAVHNSSHASQPVAAWVSSTGHSNHRRLVSFPSSNNVAEITATALVLHSWQDEDLHIHTDSKLVLSLLNRGLLTMENDGWIDSPWVKFRVMTPPQSHAALLQYLLFLARHHQGSLEVSWTKAHSKDKYNKVDTLAKYALNSKKTVNVSDFEMPAGWVDTAPTLHSCHLDFLTRWVVRETTTPPLAEACFSRFMATWPVVIQ